MKWITINFKSDVLREIIVYNLKEISQKKDSQELGAEMMEKYSTDILIIYFK